MHTEASVKQQYTVLQALASASEWTQDDVVKAAEVAVKAFPEGSAADLVQRLEPHTRSNRVDGSNPQAILRAAPFFGVSDLGPATSTAIAGIKAALDTSKADRRAAAAREALAGPRSEVFTQPVFIGIGQLLNEQTKRAIQAVASDKQVRALFDVALDYQDIQEVLAASSSDPDSWSMERVKTGPLDATMMSLPIAGITAGDIALPLFALMHARNAIDEDKLATALTGRPSGSRSMYSVTQSALSVRLTREGDQLQIGYDVKPGELESYGMQDRKAFLDYVRAAVATLSSAIAEGKPASSVQL